MNTGPAVFLFFAFVAAMAYLIFEHRRVSNPMPAQQSPLPDYPDMPISSSAIPGDLVGPGATGNSGWYLPFPSAAERALAAGM